MSQLQKVDFYTLSLIKESKEIIKLCNGYKKIVTLEEHSEVNGFYGFITSVLAKHKILVEIDFIALSEEHISVVGDQNYLREKSSLNGEALYPKII